MKVKILDLFSPQKDKKADNFYNVIKWTKCFYLHYLILPPNLTMSRSVYMRKIMTLSVLTFFIRKPICRNLEQAI